MDVLESSFPPSNGTFRSDISDRVMRPMLKFLDRTKSFFFLDVYPYFPWSSDTTNINLDYALFESKNISVTDPGTGLVYHNLFDQMVDAVYFAMKRIGYPNVRIFIAETGWPNGGDIDQIGANIYNAATYNRMSAALRSDHLAQPVGGRYTVRVQAGNDLAPAAGNSQVTGRTRISLLLALHEVDLGELLPDNVRCAVVRTIYDDHFVPLVDVLGHDGTERRSNGGPGVIGRDDDGDRWCR